MLTCCLPHALFMCTLQVYTMVKCLSKSRCCSGGQTFHQTCPQTTQVCTQHCQCRTAWMHDSRLLPGQLAQQLHA
jgi:hypothetical protein